jgi:hypothetical protein
MPIGCVEEAEGDDDELVEHMKMPQARRRNT